MKKFLVLIFLLGLVSVFYAQGFTPKVAARKTAERCLKLAENYLLADDVSSALSQAELGISYDDGISDLYYIKAVALKKSGRTNREVLQFSSKAKEIDNWIGYNQNGNRILLADLLSDTGKWVEALEELDRAPFVFSADAESVRIKTYYRIGTDEYVSKAREKINSARRIYKGELRFIDLFYNFELSLILRKGTDYIPETKVLQIADVLSEELKTYKNVPNRTECISFFFMEGEKQFRAIQAFDAAGKSDYFLPVIALKAGVYDEEKAFDEFFDFADKSCTLESLVYFSNLLQSENVRLRFFEHLNAFNGEIFQDINNDNQWENRVVYERGRPQYVHFDEDCDGVEDLYATLDFGELLSANIVPLETELFYSDYPYIGKAVLHRDDSYVVFDFSKKEVAFSPLKFDVLFENIFDEVLKDNREENPFYLPSVRSDWKNLKNMDYLANASSIELETFERQNSSVVYKMEDGRLIEACYYENDSNIYGNGFFENGMPLWRSVDYDHDGFMETTEFFKPYLEDSKDLFSESDKDFIKRTFPFFDFSDYVYLSSVFIDRDQDNNVEYKEFFSELGGKTSVWTTIDEASGVTKTQMYTRHPQKPGESLVEESSFINYSGIDLLSLQSCSVTLLSVDGVPSSIRETFGTPGAADFCEVTYEIFPGELPDFYWIGVEGDGKSEVILAQKMENEENGVNIQVLMNEKICNAIKISGKVFGKIEMELLPSDE